MLANDVRNRYREEQRKLYFIALKKVEDLISEYSDAGESGCSIRFKSEPVYELRNEIVRHLKVSGFKVRCSWRWLNFLIMEPQSMLVNWK